MSERISAKLGGFQPSLTLALKDMAQERRRQGLPIYYFGLGETKGDLAPWVSYQPMVKAASADSGGRAAGERGRQTQGHR